MPTRRASCGSIVVVIAACAALLATGTAATVVEHTPATAGAATLSGSNITVEAPPGDPTTFIVQDLTFRDKAAVVVNLTQLATNAAATGVRSLRVQLRNLTFVDLAELWLIGTNRVTDAQGRNTTVAARVVVEDVTVATVGDFTGFFALQHLVLVAADIAADDGDSSPVEQGVTLRHISVIDSCVSRATGYTRRFRQLSGATPVRGCGMFSMQDVQVHGDVSLVFADSVVAVRSTHDSPRDSAAAMRVAGAPLLATNGGRVRISNVTFTAIAFGMDQIDSLSCHEAGLHAFHGGSIIVERCVFASATHAGRGFTAASIRFTAGGLRAVNGSTLRLTQLTMNPQSGKSYSYAVWFRLGATLTALDRSTIEITNITVDTNMLPEEGRHAVALFQEQGSGIYAHRASRIVMRHWAVAMSSSDRASVVEQKSARVDVDMASVLLLEAFTGNLLADRRAHGLHIARSKCTVTDGSALALVKWDLRLRANATNAGLALAVFFDNGPVTVQGRSSFAITDSSTRTIAQEESVAVYLSGLAFDVSHNASFVLRGNYFESRHAGAAALWLANARLRAYAGGTVLIADTLINASSARGRPIYTDGASDIETGNTAVPGVGALRVARVSSVTAFEGNTSRRLWSPRQSELRGHHVIADTMRDSPEWLGDARATDGTWVVRCNSVAPGVVRAPHDGFYAGPDPPNSDSWTELPCTQPPLPWPPVVYPPQHEDSCDARVHCNPMASELQTASAAMWDDRRGVCVCSVCVRDELPPGLSREDDCTLVPAAAAAASAGRVTDAPAGTATPTPTATSSLRVRADSATATVLSPPPTTAASPPSPSPSPSPSPPPVSGVPTAPPPPRTRAAVSQTRPGPPPPHNGTTATPTSSRVALPTLSDSLPPLLDVSAKAAQPVSAVYATATATALVGGVASPTAAARVAAFRYTLRARDCAFDADDAPSIFEHPIRPTVGGGPKAAFAGACLASSLVVAAACAAFVAGARRGSVKAPAAAPGVTVGGAPTVSDATAATGAGGPREAGAGASATGPRPSTGAHTPYLCLGIAVGLIVAYLLPSVAGAATGTVRHGTALQRMVGAASVCADLGATVAVAVVSVGQLLRRANVMSRSADGGRHVADITPLPGDEAYAALVRAVTDGAKDARRLASRAWFFEDVAFGMLQGVIGGWEPISDSGCTYVAIGLVGLAVVHLGYLSLATPYASKLDALFALANGACVAAVGVAALAQLSDGVFLGVVYGQTALFFVQPVVALAHECYERRTKGVGARRASDAGGAAAPVGSDSNVAPLLLVPPAADSSTSAQNPLDGR